jgi:DEAD/DEAH box helicase domain-containing protein
VRQNPDIREYLRALESSRKFSQQIVCHRTIEATAAVRDDPRAAVDSLIGNALNKLGIASLYAHQARSIDLIRDGHDIVVCTPTASGKSLIYNLCVLENYLQEPASHALYLFPLKALAQDQQGVLASFKETVSEQKTPEGAPFSAIYDGDTKPHQRTKLRKTVPPVLITNPDMVHLSLLPYHESWRDLFKNLKYIVIDEIHTYRGLFGSHISWVLKRLMRIAAHYGSRPQCIMLSATVGNPAELGARLIGRPVSVVSKNGAPSSAKHMVFLNPWDSAAHTCAQLLEAALKRGLRTIVYTKSRKMTELITMWTKPRLGDLGNALSSYRAGFLAEERRTIEQDLAAGRLLGVISTSALELGIDIGDLDLCILVGYPGSIMATWQRSGRVGRGASESAVILIGAEDALDQHFMRDPEDFFQRSAEHAPLNPDNSRISSQHLHCAAAELPLDRNEPLVKNSATVRARIEELSREAVLHQDAEGRLWYASRKRPQNRVELRGGGVQLSIIEQDSGEIIGEIDAHRALKEAHPGAVYLHHSRILMVHRLDIEAREVIVSGVKLNYHTRPTVDKQTEIIESCKSRSIFGCRVSWGRLKVTEQVTGYRKINNFTQKIISTVPLELPEQVIETEGLWLDLQERHRSQLEDQKMHFMGAIHAVEHAMIAMFPLLILCDRNDIGGISCPHHEQTDRASIFIYDGYAGGAGLTEEAYGLIDTLLRQTEKTIRLCGCELGCPSCVHSPKCGSGNRPIDKSASLSLLQSLISDKDSPAPAIINTFPEFSKGGKNKGKQSGSHAPPEQRGLEALPDHYLVFDLETKRSADEVGGWQRAERMGMSVGVVYDSMLDGFATYFEDEADKLVRHLLEAQLVVGFNSRRFDYQVLSAYTDVELWALPSLDILEEIKDRLGYRLSLNRLIEHTLGCSKSSDGLQALSWYKQGKIREIADYCRKDVELTRNLFLYALDNGSVLFRNKAGKTVRLPLELDVRIGEIVSLQRGAQGQSSGL